MSHIFALVNCQSEGNQKTRSFSSSTGKAEKPGFCDGRYGPSPLDETAAEFQLKAMVLADATHFTEGSVRFTSFLWGSTLKLIGFRFFYLKIVTLCIFIK